MNITDYIVECLQKGKTVEIPGVGTWKTVVENAHFDEQSATFFPTRSVVVFDAATTGNEEFVTYLSDTECVTADVAKQMLSNYAQALNEKLDKEDIVAVGALGVLRLQDGAKSFVSQPIATGTDEIAPLSNVKTYNSELSDDPFAMFDPAKRAEAAAREQQDAEAKAELERMTGVANIVGGADIMQGNETVELTPQEVKERERLIKEEMKRLKQEEKDREREAREAAIREQDDAKRSEGEILPEDIALQQRAEQEALMEKARLEKEAQEARKAEERREEEERKAREKAEKEELEAKARAEKEEQRIREKQEKEEREAKKAEEKREKEELKAKEKAEREEQEAKAKAEKEAQREREKREKEEREEKARAEKEAQREQAQREKEEHEEKAKADREARIEKERQEKADKEARKEQERREKEEREAKAKADKEAQKAKEKQEKADKKAQLKAEKAEKKALKQREKEQRKAEKKARKKGKGQTPADDPLAVPALSFNQEGANETEGKKKKRRTWLWILLLLLLLLLLGCVAVYLGKPDFVKPAHDWLNANVLKSNDKETADLNIDNMVSNSDVSVSTGDGETSDNAGDRKGTVASAGAAGAFGDACLFSFSEQLTEFSTTDVEARADAINDYLSTYISNYLTAKHYSTAKVPMMERIHQYSVSRLSDLLSNDGFSEERFIPSADYVSDYISEFKKAHKGRQKQVMVQGEIMESAFLDNMLTVMVDELGLKADNAKVVLPPTPKIEKPVIKTEKKSRQGFDLIAGFYTDVNTAQKMVDRLKGYGCAAYIIEINHGYYVSMGSAKTRTLAEEKQRRAKEWYDGDISIKSF